MAKSGVQNGIRIFQNGSRNSVLAVLISLPSPALGFRVDLRPTGKDGGCEAELSGPKNLELLFNVGEIFVAGDECGER